MSSEISSVLGLVILFQMFNSSANITPEFKYKYQNDALQYFTYSLSTLVSHFTRTKAIQELCQSDTIYNCPIVVNETSQQDYESDHMLEANFWLLIASDNWCKRPDMVRCLKK